MVLGNASQPFGPSLLILGRFFFLGVGLGLDMKWAGFCQILQPHNYLQQFFFFNDNFFLSLF